MFSILPIGNGIKLFGLTHISVMIISFLLCYLIIKHKKQSVFIEKLSTIIMLVLQFILYAWYVYSFESFLLKALPLYTCRIAIYMIAIGLFFNKRFWLKLGSYWGLFGGLFGLIFPTIFNYPFPHILQIATFYLHTYLFLISAYYIFVKKIGQDKTDLKNCYISTIVFASIAHMINIILDTNYMATFKMPGVLLNLGFKLPSGICLLAVIIGYLGAITVQYMIINKLLEKEVTYDSN